MQKISQYYYLNICLSELYKQVTEFKNVDNHKKYSINYINTQIYDNNAIKSPIENSGFLFDCYI